MHFLWKVNSSIMKLLQG